MTESTFIENFEDFENCLEKEDAFIVYFNASQCGVAEALAPKVDNLLRKKYPKMKMFHVDNGTHPDIAAQLSVFVIPTILVFFGGKESLRKARHFSVAELERELARPYEMLFE